MREIQAQHPVKVEQQRPPLGVGQVGCRCDLMGDRQSPGRGQVVGDSIGEARAIARHRLDREVKHVVGSGRRPAKAGEAGRGGMHRIGGEVELGAIVGRQPQVAEGERLVAEVGKLGNADDVARALRHLGVVHGEELAMHPHADDRMAERSLRLRDLVLVVRELEVDPPGVDVEPLARGA